MICIGQYWPKVKCWFPIRHIWFFHLSIWVSRLKIPHSGQVKKTRSWPIKQRMNNPVFESHTTKARGMISIQALMQHTTIIMGKRLIDYNTPLHSIYRHMLTWAWRFGCTCFKKGFKNLKIQMLLYLPYHLATCLQPVWFRTSPSAMHCEGGLPCIARWCCHGGHGDCKLAWLAGKSPFLIGDTSTQNGWVGWVLHLKMVVLRGGFFCHKKKQALDCLSRGLN